MHLHVCRLQDGMSLWHFIWHARLRWHLHQHLPCQLSLCASSVGNVVQHGNRSCCSICHTICCAACFAAHNPFFSQSWIIAFVATCWSSMSTGYMLRHTHQLKLLHLLAIPCFVVQSQWACICHHQLGARCKVAEPIDRRLWCEAPPVCPGIDVQRLSSSKRNSSNGPALDFAINKAHTFAELRVPVSSAVTSPVATLCSSRRVWKVKCVCFGLGGDLRPEERLASRPKHHAGA